MVGLIFAAYLMFLFYLTFFSHAFGRHDWHTSYNLIPLKTIYNYLRWADDYHQLVNLAGNIAAFMPFGFLLPLIIKRFSRFKKFIWTIFLLSFFIEITQLITGVGAFDIDDIILNVLGGVVGFVLCNFMCTIQKGPNDVRPL